MNLAGTEGQITIKWIKAHVGHLGNELADEAAKEGATNLLYPRIECVAPRNYIKAKIREHMETKWNQAWIDLELCRQTKIFFPRVDRRRSAVITKQSRELFSRATRWITGHNFLRRHNNITDMIETTKKCRYCKNQDETSGHIITECEAFWRERRDCFSSFWLNPQSPNWTSYQLMDFLGTPSVACLEDENDPTDLT